MDKIIDKIKKLLMRTEENGCTPGEAATAAAQVTMLLAKHGLSMSDVNDEEFEMVKEEFVKDTKSTSVYQVLISQELEKHFGVITFSRKKYDGNRCYSKLAVYGEKIKVQAFVQTYEFIFRAYQTCWKSYHHNLNVSTQEKNRMRLSYLRGFVDGVTNEITKEENANALVVVKSKNVLDFEDTLKEGKPFRVSSTYNAEASIQGYQDGASAQRNKNKRIA